MLPFVIGLTGAIWFRRNRVSVDPGKQGSTEILVVLKNETALKQASENGSRVCRIFQENMGHLPPK
jgi:hypothetical protein